MTRETLVLLPGQLCDHRLFGPQIEQFSSAYDIIVPKLVGEQTIDGMAKSVFRHVKSRQFSVAGLSMGGIVAMAMTGMEPRRIARLALLDCNHLADTSDRRNTRNRQIAKARAGEFEQVVINELMPTYLAERNGMKRQLNDVILAMAVDCGKASFIDQSIALRDRIDQSETLSRWKKPTLVLCGIEDRLCPPVRHDEMSALLINNRRVNVDGAGHMATLENPQIVNNAIGEWLGNLPPANVPGRA